jgi:hypothetical protein
VVAEPLAGLPQTQAELVHRVTLVVEMAAAEVKVLAVLVLMEGQAASPEAEAGVAAAVVVVLEAMEAKAR